MLNYKDNSRSIEDTDDGCHEDVPSDRAFICLECGFRFSSFFCHVAAKL